MIISLRQEKTNFNMTYLFKNKDKLICNVDVPLEQGQLTSNLFFKNGETKQLYYNPSDTSFGNSLKDKLSFKILDDKTYIGRIYGDTQKIGKGKLFSKYILLYRMTYNGADYVIYEVGKGKDGLFLCGYKGEQLLFIAKKDLKVINFKDTYTLYLRDKEDFVLAACFLIYYDLVNYSDFMEVSTHHASREFVYSQKEVLDKFNQEFIDELIKKDLN